MRISWSCKPKLYFYVFLWCARCATCSLAFCGRLHKAQVTSFAVLFWGMSSLGWCLLSKLFRCGFARVRLSSVVYLAMGSILDEQIIRNLSCPRRLQVGIVACWRVLWPPWLLFVLAQVSDLVWCFQLSFCYGGLFRRKGNALQSIYNNIYI